MSDNELEAAASRLITNVWAAEGYLSLPPETRNRNWPKIVDMILADARPLANAYLAKHDALSKIAAIIDAARERVKRAERIVEVGSPPTLLEEIGERGVERIYKLAKGAMP